MKTYDLRSKDGSVLAFEVENLLLPRRCARWVVARIPGVKLAPPAPWYVLWPEVFCEFELEGAQFEIWEPFGDNSRYWIGSRAGGSHPALERVREEFRQARYFGLKARH